MGCDKISFHECTAQPYGFLKVTNALVKFLFLLEGTYFAKLLKCLRGKFAKNAYGSFAMFVSLTARRTEVLTLLNFYEIYGPFAILD